MSHNRIVIRRPLEASYRIHHEIAVGIGREIQLIAGGSFRDSSRRLDDKVGERRGLSLS